MPQYTLGRQIAVVARLWRGELDRRLHPHSLSQARYVLLTLLAEVSGPIAQNDLAEQAGISGPTLVRQLDQLESAGLVERRDAPEDRRVKHVCITAAGRTTHCDASRIALALRQELVADLPASQLTSLNASLACVLRRLETIRMSDSAK
ncbi:MAG: MarR family transcriptional regulator [Alphaproteobacteria bacterium]|nr:MarR family transcriptional regulator [Alphaproteobacteria bacterium]MCB9928074.1 MarR family transcriptional regulator [Alphaproteobacteria bacterium]